MSKVISCACAAIAGLCFMQGLAILTRGRGQTYGQREKDRIDA